MTPLIAAPVQPQPIKVYIAGPMNGLPESNYPAFREAASALETLGYEVKDPSRNFNPDPDDYHAWLRLGLDLLIRCDEVALLPGWERSGGARMEVNVAATLGMRVRPLAEYVQGATA